MLWELGCVDQVELGWVLHQRQLPVHTAHECVVGEHFPLGFGTLLLKISSDLSWYLKKKLKTDSTILNGDLIYEAVHSYNFFLRKEIWIRITHLNFRYKCSKFLYMYWFLFAQIFLVTWKRTNPETRLSKTVIDLGCSKACLGKNEHCTVPYAKSQTVTIWPFLKSNLWSRSVLLD